EVLENRGQCIARGPDELFVADQQAARFALPPCGVQGTGFELQAADVLLVAAELLPPEGEVAALGVEGEGRCDHVAEVAHEEYLACAREQLVEHGAQRAAQTLLSEVARPALPVRLRNHAVEGVD